MELYSKEVLKQIKKLTEESSGVFIRSDRPKEEREREIKNKVTRHYKRLESRTALPLTQRSQEC